ncbi:MAG: uridine kinase [Capnocytophaga sp.]|nr:uridine kinase [Capnocytophaga sp.]
MLVIGIAGGTGCGKTTVVNKIISELSNEEVSVISQDSYYRDMSHLPYSERTKVNFDHPNSIDFDLLKKHLEALRRGEMVRQPVYSFVEHNRTAETVETHPTKVIIVEGILIFSHADVRDLFDIKIYVHADSDERLIRRIKRDTAERGRDVEEVLDRYQNTLKPMHLQFIEPAKEYADIIIPNNKRNSVAIDIVKTIVYNRIFSQQYQ